MENKIIAVKVIAGSTREGRFSDKAAQWITQELEKQEGVSIEMLDLRDYEMPFFDSPESPAFKSKPYSDETVTRFTKKIAEGDAYVIVSPEYNHSTSGVLKNALDWVYQEWNEKPVGFVSYGSVGGARAVEQLRLMAIELQMAPIREAVHFAADDFFPVHLGGEDVDVLFTKYQDKVEAMSNQLIRWAKVMNGLRTS